MLNKSLKRKETVYVGNLFFDMTADDLRTAMEKFGVVEMASIIHDNRGLSKGCVHDFRLWFLETYSSI
jgi:RNA recognition motif-containing protein